MKDLFSDKSKEYAQFRPDYPDELIDYISGLCKNHESAWDCGTGNGQFAKKIADHFKKIFATDLSIQQLDNAIQASNIFYSQQAAEKSNFDNSSFDLITAAQAVHWFNFNLFFAEVKRTLKHDGIIILIGYGLLKINREIDAFITDFYTEKIGAYWDAERKYIDDSYKTIPFEFDEIITPYFEAKHEWTFNQLTGYLNTWSAVKKYNNTNAIEAIDKSFSETLQSLWGDDEKKEIRFPLFLRAGKLK